MIHSIYMTPDEAKLTRQAVEAHIGKLSRELGVPGNSERMMSLMLVAGMLSGVEANDKLMKTEVLC